MAPNALESVSLPECIVSPSLCVETCIKQHIKHCIEIWLSQDTTTMERDCACLNMPYIALRHHTPQHALTCGDTPGVHRRPACHHM